LFLQSTAFLCTLQSFDKNTLSYDGEKMKIRIFKGIVISIAVWLFAGCSQIPQQAINDTKTALEAAKKAEAHKYARSQFQAARVSYELAKKEITEESRKLPFMRKYSKIIETLKSANSAAESALSAAETAKTLMTGETQGLLANAQAIVDRVDSIIIKAAAKKKNTDTLSAELDSVNEKIRDAGAVLGSGDLFAAKEKAALAQTSAQTLAANAEALGPPKKASPAKKK
jgi:hypothetical protein